MDSKQFGSGWAVPRATPEKENRRFQRELKTNDFPGARITSNLYPAGSGKTKFCKPTAGTRPRAGAQFPQTPRARRLEQEIVQKHELLLNRISASARPKHVHPGARVKNDSE
ncbi:hypothetical protein [uncultured Rikenella sp.]|uniref:hypothetical protein n=1 Tax=uncultured Rikenella sp. TaxID=368003 RepID=UPI002638361F|nr:hypothetical protein [uncultured Rikenella sp.]